MENGLDARGPARGPPRRDLGARGAQSSAWETDKRQRRNREAAGLMAFCQPAGGNSQTAEGLSVFTTEWMVKGRICVWVELEVPEAGGTGVQERDPGLRPQRTPGER